MRTMKLQFTFLLLPLLSILLMYKYMTLPGTFAEFNLALVVFLCLISVLERLLVSYYTPLWFSFFIVVLGLLIFDVNSTFYSLFYFGTGFIFTIIKNRGRNILNYLPATSVGIIALTIGNEYYNHFTNQSYGDRYLALILLLMLSILLVHFYNYLKFRAISSFFVSTFLPIVFKLLVIFPLLSIFNYFNFGMITLLFLLYIYFLSFCRKRLLDVNESHVQELIHTITKKHRLDIFFMELGSVKGVYYPKRNIIAIDEKLDYPEQLQTIIHEYLHHLLNRKIKPHYLEELIITFLEGIISWAVILKSKKGAKACQMS
jgi:hypothetical protein